MTSAGGVASLGEAGAAGAAPAERGDCPFGFDLERAGAGDDERVDERRDALKRYLDAFANTLVSETDQESFSHLMEQVLP